MLLLISVIHYPDSSAGRESACKAGDPVQFHEHEVLKHAVSKFENFDRKVRKLQREVSTAKIDYNAKKHEYRSAYLNYSDSDDSN